MLNTKITVKQVGKNMQKDFIVLDNAMGEEIKLYNGDAIEGMKLLPSNSIDLICVDLPYGTTQNKWDVIIPLDDMWKEFNRVKTERGIIALTAAQPFTSILVASNLKQFKYDLVWEKSISSNQLNVKKQPLRSHESVLIFYDKPGTYNEQRTEGKPYKINRKSVRNGGCYGDQVSSSKDNDGFRHARSVIKIANPRIKGGHPTEKPVALMEYLIKCYSNEGDTVLDCCMGSGSTGEAAKTWNRKFIGIELNGGYFKKAKRRLEK